MAQKTPKRSKPRSSKPGARPSKAAAKAGRTTPSARTAANRGPATPATASPPRRLNAWSLTKSMAQLLWQHKRLFIGIMLVYGLLDLILVQGLANTTDIATLRQHLTQALGGHLASFGSSLASFVIVTGSAASGSAPGGSVYQFFLLILVSLATIWTLRQLTVGKKISIRDAYYQGMSPLVPFILVLLVVGLELLPILIGSTLFSLVMNNGIAVGSGEQSFWVIILILSAVLSFYLLASSLFALYIVTAPATTPMQALRAARKLVRGQRLLILRTILFLPLLLLLGAIIIMAPIVIWLTPLARWLFLVLTVFSIAPTHAYMYSLYLELARD